MRPAAVAGANRHSRAKWILHPRVDDAEDEGSESERMATLIRGFLRRAADVGAGSLGLPVESFAPADVTAGRAARVAVREARA